ncbi:hypothetical protein KBP30_38495 [Streptomyces sp. Go40/10]|uniref:hypothetical protein n=1 Tax=Streptomyces sp. Go40/10 TaxID=2825844 RepID=UPI001E62F0D0|nr:hypothetical protein [Streptomyces sp. Go40/10]UFR06710.1 hypothetical protein KBP30_38495 [Streptomyces sp. Go40/10]
MAGVRGEPVTAPGPLPLPARALARESGRAREFLAAGEWRLSPADARAVAAVLARLSAPLPARRGPAEKIRATDRDRRLQRVLRAAVHHLDAGAVSPPAAALLAAVARALLPWHDAPNPPKAAAAARYAAVPGTADGAAPPTGAGEALLPELIRLFSALAATSAPGAVPRTPPVPSLRVRHSGRFRHYSRPGPGVWAARTVACPGCGGKDGPWTVTCDWRRAALVCPCGVVNREHGLSLSEIWLVLPDV